jgi:hypothetical protein
MEQILWLDGLPYDPRCPVACYDERPCFLLGEAVPGLAMKAGQVAKEHYAYQKHGACNLLATLEPLTGKRLAQVTKQRTKREFALPCQQVEKEFREAEKSRIVLDNRNTHNASAFYETFRAEEAFRLAQKFEFYYTPPKASWLNMIEPEFSALARLCVQRRIATQGELEREVLALVKERAAKGVKIEWQFSIEKARTKLNRHYAKVNEENCKYKET